MSSVSDKSDSVNEFNQEISELMKLHMQGVWQNAHEFIRQLARRCIVTVVCWFRFRLRFNTGDLTCSCFYISVSSASFILYGTNNIIIITTADPREATFLYQRISVAIQRFNAVCLANSLTVSESPS